MAQQPNSSWGSANQQTLDLELPSDEFVDFLNLDSLDTTFTYPLFGAQIGSTQDLGQFDFSGPTFNYAHDGHSSNLLQDAYPGYIDDGVYAPTGTNLSMHGNQSGASNTHTFSSHGAPPTPNSAPMHAKNAEYYQQSSGSNIIRSHPNLPNDVRRITTAFSPFVSPEIDACASAVSHTPEYGISGVYNLSPLTSPAMQPEVPRSTRQHHPRTSQFSSPTPSEWNSGDRGCGEDEELRPSKTRKKVSTKSSDSSTTTKSRKAPASTNKRKASLSKHLGPNPPSNNIRYPLRRDNTSRDSAMPGSASNSISPRPLDEVLMGPPPKPVSTSATSTPYMPPRGSSSQTTSSPATPASMMGFRAQLSDPTPSSDGAVSDTLNLFEPNLQPLTGGLEFLELPEAASLVDERSPVTNLHSNSNISKSIDDIHGPRPRFQPNVHTAKLVSPDGPAGLQKPGSKVSQISKKRSSNGSTLVSPALRPKVSPNVKPLLPDGAGMDSETHTLLLASRSNYENILSGAHLPGVSYPADLGANLSSKRTSHKLAEQGRRNRINFALQEMQTLLPVKFTATLPASKDLEKADSLDNDRNNSGRSGQTPIQSGNSKAATVECAIEYIKHLQRECLKKDELVEKLKIEAGRVQEAS